MLVRELMSKLKEITDKYGEDIEVVSGSLYDYETPFRVVEVHHTGFNEKTKKFKEVKVHLR